MKAQLSYLSLEKSDRETVEPQPKDCLWGNRVSLLNLYKVQANYSPIRRHRWTKNWQISSKCAQLFQLLNVSDTNRRKLRCHTTIRTWYLIACHSPNVSDEIGKDGCLSKKTLSFEQIFSSWKEADCLWTFQCVCLKRPRFNWVRSFKHD